MLDYEKIQKIQHLFDTTINPSLAMHGGFAELIDVRENKVYVRMGGGCHGCGMVESTLKQGIEKFIKEEIPEIEELVDTTQHADGKNPYYQPTPK
jgi:Fe/S biogenesis protein NfuA